ncbi:MAG: CHAT domain-containing tetratricopeptide repeat protein [Bacteroidia bacterium]|nr:CHAT domain-containing tetratricopeptide repeat protein [Bacteroidia bacterium]
MKCFFALWMGIPLLAQPLLHIADSLLKQGRYAAALALYDSVLRTQAMPDTLRLRVYLKGAEAWSGVNKPQEALVWVASGESLALKLRDTLGYAELLGWEGFYHRQRRAYAEAGAVLRQALRLVEAQGAQKSVLYAMLWRHWATLAHEQREYERAAEGYRRAAGVLETLGLTEHAGYASVLHGIALLHQEKGSYVAAESLHMQVKGIRAKVLGTEHPDYARTLMSLAIVYYSQGRYAEAETLYLETKAIQAKVLGTEHPDYARTLNNLANVYLVQGRYAEAETLYLEAKAIGAKVLGIEHPTYASTLNNLAIVYQEQGRYVEAEALYLEVKAIQEKGLGTQHPDYARTLGNLAIVYSAQGRYAEAEALYLEVKAIREKVQGTDHPDYAHTLNNLAIVYYEQGRYAEAEALYLEVKAIREKVQGTQHPDYAGTLIDLANVYRAQGRYTEAEVLYLEAKAIQAKVLGTEYPDYARTLMGLANVYYEQGRYAEAEALYQEVKAIRAKVLGTEHPSYTSTLHNLATVHLARGRYAEAEGLYLEAKAIQAKVLGTEHPEYAHTLGNLANVYQNQGRYAEAEGLYLEARAIQAKILGTEHPDYWYYSLYDLARLYQLQRRYGETDTLWNVIILKTFSRIRREFPTLSTAARQNLLENLLMSRLSDFQRYVAERQDCSEITELGYRAARSFKGILLSSTEAMKRLIETSRDSTLHAHYRQWKHLADQYAFFTLQENYRAADSLWKTLQEVERKIVLRLPAMKDFLPDLSSEPLFPSLRSEEALVEVVRVPLEKKDSLLYLFYLLLPSGRKHRLHLYVHRVDTLWEQRVRNAYEVLRSLGSVVSGVPYRLLWGFLDSLLPAKVKVVYFSPDGVYYLVNVATLYDAQRRQFVADRYEVRYIASSRRLLLRRGRFAAQKPVVVGNPDFGGLPDSAAELRTRSYRLFEGGIPPLPGAEVEAKGIAQLLGVEVVIGKAATEGLMKHLQSPQLLHIATHGYFVGGRKNPLLAGGLLLAQAAVWDSLFPPLGRDDGRLTAQEASNLNLIGTELVVLSACETGLGEVRGEGLYGLQRAFLEAGAQRVITTLWQIDDEATRELMLSFYQSWVKRKRGEGVDEVFNRTLRTFREKHPEPYYWGAFVVMR